MSLPPFRTLLSLILLQALLACGGGSSSGNFAPVAVTDVYSGSWNVPISLDVMANDREPENETLRLISASGAVNGTVAIVSGRLLYTPAPGFYGDETLSYVIGDGHGNTATGRVELSIRARLLLRGSVYLGAAAPASVIAKVGTREVLASTDSAGNYRIELETGDGSEPVSLEAVGVGDRRRVGLYAVLGDLGGLIFLAGNDFVLDTAELPGLELSELNTASYRLAELYKGAPLASSDELEALLPQLDPQALVEMAAVVRRAGDADASLPAGFADTRALLRNSTAYQAHLNALKATPAEGFDGAMQRLMDDRYYLRALNPAVDDSVIRLLPGSYTALQEGAEISLGLAGLAEGSLSNQSNYWIGAPWAVSDGALGIALPTRTGYSNDELEVETGVIVTQRREYSQLQVKRLRGLPGLHLASYRAVGEHRVLRNNVLQSITPLGRLAQPAAYIDGNALQELTAAELAGKTWAGLPDHLIVPGFTVRAVSQQLNADGTGSDGMRWTAIANELKLSYPDQHEQIIYRLGKLPNGRERWLVQTIYVPEGRVTGVHGVEVMGAVVR
ncbi:Ig-like domain-containing protein [Chitinimonas viridis]|uniref:Ig-like domain-containing protein n=1 Tax=Chitinimonas viridis TaxID=664880 RepID=A0ABT8B392_9NEIS|nr:Ig-like domain-containing protein [Chitinimonas viridis]MDN3576295.1 Ig-like domain-containing protein [Chitinimonas viridis]